LKTSAVSEFAWASDKREALFGVKIANQHVGVHRTADRTRMQVFRDAARAVHKTSVSWSAFTVIVSLRIAAGAGVPTRADQKAGPRFALVGSPRELGDCRGFQVGVPAVT